MSLSATLFGRDSAIFKATNILGLGIPGWLDKKFGAKDMEIEGPRLSDLSVQTSTYGAPIPRLYGTITVMGNLLWLENGKLKETIRKNNSSGGGGKGGGGGSSKPTTTYSYSATFHLGLCEGPIVGVRRIWCGDKLIYNAGSNDIETIIASNKKEKGWTLYPGTDQQMPDSRYEADVGAGNASAHRGMAYISFRDFQLADFSNTLQASQLKVEVVVTGESAVVPVDALPGTEDDFSWLKVFGDIGELYGLRLMDNSRSISSGIPAASFDYRDYRLGALRSPTATTSISNLYIDATAEASTVRSSDSRSWYQYKSTDTFITGRAHIRTDDDALNGSIIQMNSSTGFAQDIIEASRTGENTYNFLFSYNSTPDRSKLDRIGYAPVVNNGAKYNIVLSLSESAGWNISTAGDVPYEWNITGASDSSVKQFNINIYSETLGVVIDSFSGALSSLWPRMISGSMQTQKVVCRVVDGVAYLIGKDRTNDGRYIVSIIGDAGTQIEYGFTALNAVGEELSAIWPYDENQGIALTTNRIVQWRRYYDGVSDLAQVVDSEVALSGLLEAGDINSSLLSGSVRGYRVSGGSIRSGIEPLQAAFPFDVIQSGYQIKGVPRGQSVSAAIPQDDLGANAGSEAAATLNQSREMDTQLPARTTVQFLDPVREYAASEQYSERINTDAVNRVSRELALALTVNEGAGVAEVLQNAAWLERSDFDFTLPPTYLSLEPSDIVSVEVEQATYELRITELNQGQDGLIECKAKPNRAALYSSNAVGGEGVVPDGTIPLEGDSLFIALDIPVVDETLQNNVGFVGVMTGDTNGWPGGLLVRSSDGGQTWQDLQAFNGKASLGIASDTLPSSNATLIDQRSLTVSMISGELESVTRDQMLSGVNYAAYGVDGRWEIVRFQTATLQADGRYLLSGFVRGERGTEWATGLHATGDYFVLLDDPDNAFIGAPIEFIGLERQYRAITSGTSVDDAADTFFAYQGVNLECLSPVYAKGVRDGSSNFTGSFTRRTRLSSSWWTTGVVAPVGEASEAYEIDVMSGSSVARTITSLTQSFSYSAANQTTDFGSPQSSITFRIYQLSAVVGRGYPLEVTL